MGLEACGKSRRIAKVHESVRLEGTDRPVIRTKGWILGTLSARASRLTASGSQNPNESDIRCRTLVD